jgi:hypothetical protein
VHAIETEVIAVKRLITLIAASALLFAACGGDSGPDPAENPKDALVEGLRALGEEGLTVTLSVNSTPEDLATLAEGGMDAETAGKVLDSSVVFTTNGETDPEASQFEMAVNVAGIENAIELKVVDKVLYARAAVRELAEEFGADTSEFDALAAQTPPGFEFIGPALEGEWLSLPGLDQLAQQLGGGAIQEPSEGDQEQAQALIDDMVATFESSSEVTHEGSDDVGDHLVATVNIREFYEGFSDAIGSLGGLAGAQTGTLPPASEVPDEELAVDFWVDDGRVVQVEFDFTQASEFPESEFPEGIETLGLRAVIEEFDGAVEAPEDATEIDINALMQGFLGGGMTDGGTGTDGSELPADFCEQLEGAPEEVVSQFAEECPELQP